MNRLNKSGKQYLKKLPAGFLLLLLLFVAALLSFGVIIHEVIWEKEETLDTRISEFVSGHMVSPGVTSLMKGVSFFASNDFLLAAYSALFIWYLFFEKKRKLAAGIAIIGISGSLVNSCLKGYFQRIRPSDPLIDPLFNFSFPSGHASSGFIFYGLLIYLIWKENIPKTYKYIITVLLFLFVLLIGFSRIYLRVHYTSDVMAGFCIGFAWLTFALWLLEHLKKRN